MENQTTRQISVDLTPERHPDESFKDYKERRAYSNRIVRKWLQGRLVWDGRAGTYARVKHGEIGIKREEID
jgi:hypothetical protein